MFTHSAIQHRLRERRLVGFVMPILAIAPEFDERIAPKRLSEFSRSLHRPHACFWIIAVDMENRHVICLRQIRAVLTAESVLWIRGESNLIIDDHMERATDVISGEFHKVEAFRNRTLPRERRVPMDQDRNDFSSLIVSAQILLCTCATKHDSVHEFQVGRIGRCGQMHHSRCGLSIRAVSLMIFHIAATFGETCCPCLFKFSQHLLVFLANDIRQQVDSASVSECETEFTRTKCRASFDQLIEHRDDRVRAFQTKAFLADISHR